MLPDKRKLIQIAEQNNASLSAMFTTLLISIYTQTKRHEYQKADDRVVHKH